MTAWLICFSINIFLTLFVAVDTDIYNWKDVVAMIACCFLPIIPIGYCYRWCNKFVQGEN